MFIILLFSETKMFVFQEDNYIKLNWPWLTNTVIMLPSDNNVFWHEYFLSLVLLFVCLFVNSFVCLLIVSFVRLSFRLPVCSLRCLFVISLSLCLFVVSLSFGLSEKSFFSLCLEGHSLACYWVGKFCGLFS